MPLLFAPDLDADNPGNIQAADGIRPTVRGYGSFQTMLEYGIAGSGWGALTTTPNNMWGHHWSTNGRVLAGTSTRIYELSLTASGTFTVTDVSKGGAAYTAPSYSSGTDDEQDPSYWCFASVGDNVFASNKFTSRIQVQTTKADVFEDVAGSPACSSLVTFKNFLIAINCGDYGSVTGMKDMVAWSALGNTASWVPDQATQAGYQRLLDIPGRCVVGKVLGEQVIIYKQNCIYAMRYDGPALLFTFQLVEQNIGINAAYNYPPPLVDVGNAHVFVGAEDIYFWNGQGTPQSITIGTVRRYLRSTYFNVNSGRLSPTRVSHDVQTGDVYFWDYGLVFNHWLKKWGALPTAEIAVAVATCESNIPAIGGGAPGVINDPGMLIAKSDKRIYNRYHYSLDNSAYTYNNMNLQVEGGRNDAASTLQRVVPQFSIVPAGTCTLSYYRRNAYGVTAVADSTAVWDSTNYRFDLLRNAYWHRCDIGIVSSSAAAELSDIAFVYAPAGKRVERQAVGSR